MIRDYLQEKIIEVLSLNGLNVNEVHLEHPADLAHGDYATNVAMMSWKQLPENFREELAIANPRAWAEYLKSKFEEVLKDDQIVEKVEVAGPGFINFKLRTQFLLDQLATDNPNKLEILKGKKIMVEYAHPNTHKEMHIGHMRTMITGEALARIFEFSGAEVFRANYQGDIGPHVAKSIWGTMRLLKEKNMSWEEAEKLSHSEKAHLLGEGYVLGNKLYEEYKQVIDELNNQIYRMETDVKEIYERTRRWSLEYYDQLYDHFYTTFDRKYFESEIAAKGKKIVEKHIGPVFEESDGAIIFDGEPYGLHKRVFVTGNGNPTYEGKEMGLAPTQYEDFPFDVNIHVVANEQNEYFKVVFKALEKIDPKFEGKEHHLSMGMVQLVGQKISSRKGVVITVDGLVQDLRDLLGPLVSNDELTQAEREQIVEAGAIAAVKYSVLKNNTHSNVAFDLEQSISLSGDSGPYLQYTHARCCSVLEKATMQDTEDNLLNFEKLASEEVDLLRILYRFHESVEEAARDYAPNTICLYLFELAQNYNSFYNKHSILAAKDDQTKQFRLLLTKGVQQQLHTGLHLLGIKALQKM